LGYVDQKVISEAAPRLAATMTQVPRAKAWELLCHLMAAR